MENYDKPDYKSKVHEHCMGLWGKTQDFWTGARALRKSDDYLTKFSREADEDYAARKKAAELFNVFRGTVQTVVGLVFKAKVLPEDAPPPIEALFPDMDLLGNDLPTFLRHTFMTMVRDGLSFILVDAPPPIDPTTTAVTLADVKERRPFWRHYDPDQIINWRFETINGVETLVQLTLYEKVMEPEGIFGEKEVEQWRVLRPGEFTVYRKVDGKQGEFYVYEEGATALDVIPLVPVQANKKALFHSDPPYMELLETNCTHYNSVSVLREALKYIVPMPVFTVDTKDDALEFQKLTVGANRSVILWGENPTAQYLELQGHSIEELRNDIGTLETRMAKMGVEKFAPTEGDGFQKTAYEVGSDNRKQMSEISVMARNLEDSVEQAFKFTAMYINAMGSGNAVEEKTEVRLTLDYDKLTFSIEQMEYINSLVDTNKLSLETFLDMLPQIIDLPEDFDPKEERERLLRQRIDTFPEL